MKPYQQIPIVECYEPLLPLPLAQFAVEDPHPYVQLAAPYGGKSPYFLRQGVLEALLQAQAWLQQVYPNWRIQIFDAYRPIAVQQYMVDYTFAETVRNKGLVLEQLTDAQRQTIWAQVYQFWAVPSADPKMPPPHSTGAAIDVSLVDASGTVVNMGSPIDEMSPRSHPNFFAQDFAQETGRSGEEDLRLEPVSESDRATFHAHRQILTYAMTTAGFQQHPGEWWHFSLGDQLWAWLKNQQTPGLEQIARYGAI
ncbi:MAG TPA: M15 family metallopeptidase [Coleofasciculaceae cyanobacterium]